MAHSRSAGRAGSGVDTTRADGRTAIAPGSTLLLHTDGVVERRSEDLTVGIEHLAGVARTHSALPVDDFVDRVLDEMLDAPLADDVAVLGIRFGSDDPTAQSTAEQ